MGRMLAICDIWFGFVQIREMNMLPLECHLLLTSTMTRGLPSVSVLRLTGGLRRFPEQP